MCQCQNKPILVPFLLLQKVHGEKDFSAVPAWTSLAAAHSCGGSQVCQALHSPGTGLGTKWPPVHRTIHGPGSRLAPARPVGPYYYTLASQWYESCQKLLPLHNILNIKETSKYTLAFTRQVPLWGNIVSVHCREEGCIGKYTPRAGPSGIPGFAVSQNPGIFKTEIPGFFGIFCCYVLDPLERSFALRQFFFSSHFQPYHHLIH